MTAAEQTTMASCERPLGGRSVGGSDIRETVGNTRVDGVSEVEGRADYGRRINGEE